MRNDGLRLDYNLQMFAEGGAEDNQDVPGGATDKGKTPKPDGGKPEPSKSIEEQLQEALVLNAKLKKAQEKASHEAAEFKKLLRAKQTEDEIALQEKAEREAEKEELINSLKRENQINKYTKSFLALKYTSDEAEKAAIAQYDGETDELMKIQSEVQARLVQEEKDKWYASRPELNAGVGGEKPEVTKEQFDSFSYSEMVEFQAKYPETYKKYIK